MTAFAEPADLIVGANELFRDGLGAVGARNSARIESNVGNKGRAIRLVVLGRLWYVSHWSRTCALRESNRWFWPGLVIIGLIDKLLQNVRRPIYVSPR